MISFEQIFKTVAKMFPLQCKQSWYKVSVRLLLELVVDSFLSLQKIKLDYSAL